MSHSLVNHFTANVYRRPTPRRLLHSPADSGGVSVVVCHLNWDLAGCPCIFQGRRHCRYSRMAQEIFLYGKNAIGLKLPYSSMLIPSSTLWNDIQISACVDKCLQPPPETDQKSSNRKRVLLDFHLSLFLLVGLRLCKFLASEKVEGWRTVCRGVVQSIWGRQQMRGVRIGDGSRTQELHHRHVSRDDPTKQIMQRLDSRWSAHTRSYLSHSQQCQKRLLSVEVVAPRLSSYELSSVSHIHFLLITYAHPLPTISPIYSKYQNNSGLLYACP